MAGSACRGSAANGHDCLNLGRLRNNQIKGRAIVRPFILRRMVKIDVYANVNNC